MGTTESVGQRSERSCGTLSVLGVTGTGGHRCRMLLDWNTAMHHGRTRRGRRKCQGVDSTPVYDTDPTSRPLDRTGQSAAHGGEESPESADERAAATSTDAHAVGPPATSLSVCGGMFGVHSACYRLTDPLGHVAHLPTSPHWICLLYTSPSPRDQRGSRMPSSA